MLQDKGYDSLFYPHVTDYGGRPKYNTFMTFDPKQTIPRFSPEGMQAAAERGVQNPMPKDLAYDEGGPKNWSLPRGILKKITDPEPAGPVWDRVAERQQQWQTEYDKQFASPMQDFTDLKKKFENKEISGEQFWKEYDKIFNHPPSPPPPSALTSSPWIPYKGSTYAPTGEGWEALKKSVAEQSGTLLNNYSKAYKIYWDGNTHPDLINQSQKHMR
jgi:hypothetical protein